MTAAGIELGYDADAGLRPEIALELERGIQPRAAGTDDDRVHLVHPVRRDDADGVPGDERHEIGATADAAPGSKKAMTAMPRISQTSAMASRMPVTTLRTLRLVT